MRVRVRRKGVRRRARCGGGDSTSSLWKTAGCCPACTAALALKLSTVTPATVQPTTITWTSTGGSSVYGQKITLAADVTTTGTGPVTGVVDFFNNGGTKPIGSAPVLATGKADLVTGKLPLGSDAITATYVGNATFASSTTTATVTQTVAVASTTTVLYAFPNPTGYGQKTFLTAVVSPVSPSTGRPTGTVTFDLVTESRGPSNPHFAGDRRCRLPRPGHLADRCPAAEQRRAT